MVQGGRQSGFNTDRKGDYSPRFKKFLAGKSNLRREVRHIRCQSVGADETPKDSPLLSPINRGLCSQQNGGSVYFNEGKQGSATRKKDLLSQAKAIQQKARVLKAAFQHCEVDSKDVSFS